MRLAGPNGYSHRPVSLLGGPYLTMKRVTIKMAPEFGAGNLLEAEKVRANLAVLPLLGGNVVHDS